MDRGIAGEDRARAVAVVNVQVHHQDPALVAAGPQLGDGGRHVVVGAEALPPVGESVVETAAQVDGDPAAVEGQGVAARVPPDHEALQGRGCGPPRPRGRSGRRSGSGLRAGSASPGTRRCGPAGAGGSSPPGADGRSGVRAGRRSRGRRGSARRGGDRGALPAGRADTGGCRRSRRRGLPRNPANLRRPCLRERISHLLTANAPRSLPSRPPPKEHRRSSTTRGSRFSKVRTVCRCTPTPLPWMIRRSRYPFS